jgi:hypothetical protein
MHMHASPVFGGGQVATQSRYFPIAAVLVVAGIERSD